jgi:hypothetical protein
MRLWNGPFFNASDKPNPKEPIGLWLCKQSHAKKIRGISQSLDAAVGAAAMKVTQIPGDAKVAIYLSIKG